MSLIPHILKLDVAGLPVEWVSWQTAATIYARDRVRWEAGEARFTIFGGIRCDGSQSQLEINSIIAVKDKSGRYRRGVPPLTNRALFQRDGYLCMYCGRKFCAKELTREHVVPMSRGGRDVWTNVLTACVRCNHTKDARTPQEADMLPIGVPYEPDMARYLLLIASGRVTGCQQAFLEKLATRCQRLS
jgi:5-methylcytosine-specific restriction endonuclease McrA